MRGDGEKERAGEFATLGEMVVAARRRLEPNVWNYLTGGAETETTLKRNRRAIDSLALRPRVLCDVTHVDTSATLLGDRLRIPVVLAPIGAMELIHPQGAVPGALAAESFGVTCFLSSVSQPDMAAVREKAGGPMVYQLYVRGDEDWVVERVQRAVDLGFRGLCLTVDTAAYSRRERDLMSRFMPRPDAAVAGEVFQAGLDWDMVRRLRDRFDIPFLLKGIATAEDAALAVREGVAVVYVSNHGGRQLDHGRGAIETLPEIVEAVGGKAEIVVDGGFARGTDVVKAIALGARAVGVGKLLGWSLAAAGQAGVARMLDLLETEIATAMRLLGVTGLGGLEPGHVHPAQAVTPPDATSAFPLIDLSGA